MLKSRALCLLVAAAALIAGCGGGSSKTDTYKKDAEKVANQFKTSAQSASQQVQAASTKQGRIQGLEALKNSVNNAADGFAKLDPPDDAKADHNALITELRALAGDVDGVEQALKTDDTAAAKSLLPKLQSDQSQIQTTLQSLQGKIGD